jgi:hypothetical protein
LQRFRDGFLAGLRAAHIGLQATEEFVHVWILRELVPRTRVGCGWPGSWFLGIHD